MTEKTEDRAQMAELGRRTRLRTGRAKARGGSTPPLRITRGSGGIGRRAGLRIQWAKARGGSTPPFRIELALVAELVDAADSKSVGPKARGGSIPPWSTLFLN